MEEKWEGVYVCAEQCSGCVGVGGGVQLCRSIRMRENPFNLVIKSVVDVAVADLELVSTGRGRRRGRGFQGVTWCVAW
jgi:hypothetical protein